MDGSGQNLRVIRVDLGVHDPVVVLERNKRSKVNNLRGIERMMLTYLGLGTSAVDVLEVGGEACAHDWISKANMLKT